MDILSRLLTAVGLVDQVALRKSDLRIYAIGPFQPTLDGLTKAGYPAATTRVRDLKTNTNTPFRSAAYDVGIAINVPLTKKSAWDRIGHLIERLEPDGLLAIACENPATSLHQFSLEPTIRSDDDLREMIADQGYCFDGTDLPQAAMPDGIFSLITARRQSGFPSPSGFT